MDYDKIVKFAEANGYELNQRHKDILDAICNDKMTILPRQHGRFYAMELVKEYIESENNNEEVKEHETNFQCNANKS